MGFFSRKEKLVAPVSGNLIPLSRVSDPVFSQGMMGEGFAVEPTNAKVVAPIDGVIKSIFPTKHALTLTSNQGRDLLIHIGIDTVQLKGVGFQVLVEDGQRVSSGESLVIFDCDQIKAEKLSDVIMVLFPEDKDIKLEVSEKKVSEGELLFKI